MTRARSLIALGAVAVLALGACGDDDGDASTATTTTTTTVAPGNGDAAAAAVTVEGAWARTSPMMASNGAAYMELTADSDDRLVAARVGSSVAARAELHETAMDPDSGEMAMNEVDGIDLPAGQTVTLEPGGYHVMLLDLTEPLEPGNTIELTLVFERAGEVVVEAEVRDMAMNGG